MTNHEMIQTLKKEVETNKVANAVLHSWALRERARAQVTIDGLSQRMRAEGFEFEAADYAQFLRLLASLGIGRLETTSGGKVVALKDVKTKLQSIGVAVVGTGNPGLARFKQRNRFVDVAAKNGNFNKMKEELDASAPITVTVQFNNKPVTLQVPDNLTASEIGLLITKLRG